MQKYTYTPNQVKPQNLIIDGHPIKPGIVMVSDKQADTHGFKSYVKAGLFTKVEEPKPVAKKVPAKKVPAKRTIKKTEVKDDN